MNYVNALTLFRDGHDTAEIAAILGCSEATAYNSLHRLREGMQPLASDHGDSRPRWHYDAIKMREAGRTYQQIADRFDVSATRAWQITRHVARGASK